MTIETCIFILTLLIAIFIVSETSYAYVKAVAENGPVMIDALRSIVFDHVGHFSSVVTIVTTITDMSGKKKYVRTGGKKRMINFMIAILILK